MDRFKVDITRVFSRVFFNPGGFTLLEVVVALGIMSLATGLVGRAVFQTVSVQRYWQDDAVAVKDLRHAGSWLSSDALVAETTNLVDGAPAGDSLTITWTDGAGTPHTSVYSVSGDTLVRTADGVQNNLAGQVQSVSFSLSGQVLSFSLEVLAGRGATETVSLQTYLRALQ